MLGLALGLQYPRGLIGGGGFDADYQNILNTLNTSGFGLPSPEQQVIANDLLVNLKSTGVWDRMDSFIVLATNGDGNSALIDWKKLTYSTAVNNPTFITNRGYVGNLLDAYIDLGFTPATAGNHAISNASLGAWYSNVLTRSEDKIGFGTRQSGNNKSTGASPYDNTRRLVGVNNDGGFDVQNYTRANGLFVVTRNNPINYDFYLNSILVGNYTGAENTVSLATENFYALAYNAGNSTPLSFSDDEIAMLYVGQSFTATDVVNLHSAFNTYLTNISL